MNNNLRAAGIAIILMAGLAAPAQAETYAGPGFSGEAHISEDGAPIQKFGTVSVDSHGFRMDMVAQGQQAISILKWDNPLVIVLMPAQNMYMELPPDQSGWSEFENRACSGYSDAENVGDEVIGGRATEIWRCTGPLNTPQGREPSDATVWYDNELKFEIRVDEDNGNRFEIRNIKIGRQDSSLFEIPAGYSKFDMNAMMQQMMQQQQQQ